MIILICFYVLLRILRFWYLILLKLFNLFVNIIVELHTIFITYSYTSRNILSDLIYKSEGSSNDDGDTGGTDNNNEGNGEETFEIEDEIANHNKLIREAKDAIKLNDRLPYYSKRE